MKMEEKQRAFALQITVSEVAMTVDFDQCPESGLEDTCSVSSLLLNDVVLSNFYVSHLVPRL